MTDDNAETTAHPFTRYTYEIPDDWFSIALAAHAQLLYIDSEYHIDQIKEKFGGLRYYYSSDRFSFGTRERERMEEIVSEAERLVDELEQARREARNGGA